MWWQVNLCEPRAIQPRVAPLVTVKSSLSVGRCAFAFTFVERVVGRSTRPTVGRVVAQRKRPAVGPGDSDIRRPTFGSRDTSYYGNPSV